MVREFRLWLNRQSTETTEPQVQLNKKTQNYYLIALRAFLKYLARQEIKSMPAEKIELAKVNERQLDLITQIELKTFRCSKGNDLKSLRDKAILELLFSTGLRVSELCSLTSEIDLTTSELSIRGKGGKVREFSFQMKLKMQFKNIYQKERYERCSFVQIKIKK